MKFAKWIRDFLSTLFGSTLVVELRAELAEARRERDYFRGQWERIQLMVAPQRSASSGPRPDWRTQNPPAGLTRTGGRKTWAQLQKENTDRIAAEMQAEAEKKKNQPAAKPS
jgi:hypothetical protein